MQRDSTKHWPRRPPRLNPLFDTLDPFYFVKFNTYKRRLLLARPEVHEAFCIFCSNAKEHDIAVGRYVINARSHSSLCCISQERLGPIELDPIAGHYDWQTITARRPAKAALAGRLFRSSTAQFRKLLAKMGARAHESCPSTTVPNTGGLAISRRDCSDSFHVTPAVAASLCRGARTATQRRGYTVIRARSYS